MTPAAPPGPPGGSGRAWRLAAAVGAAAAAGLAFRVAHLDIPLRYDEATTFLHYASRGWGYAARTYDTPNNHVLHTLLVHLSTSVFGDGPTAVRLPALVAGALVPVAAAWLALRAAGARVAVAAAALTAAWPVLVAYSTNARGYTMLVVAALACGALALELTERPTRARWMGLALVGALGAWTLPVMAIPFGGVLLWLAWRFVRSGGPDRRRRLVRVALTGAAAAVLAVILYGPVLAVGGTEALLENKWVAAGSPDDLVAAIPGAVRGVVLHWFGGLPAAVTALVAAGLLADALLPGGRGSSGLLAALLAAAALFVLVQRNLAYERTWLWLLPFALVSAAAGLDRLAGRLPRGRDAIRAGALALAFGLLGRDLFADDPVRRSMETGAFPEVRAVGAFLRDSVPQDEQVFADVVSVGPLEYWFHRNPVEAQPPGARVRRMWLVVRDGAEERPDWVLVKRTPEARADPVPLSVEREPMHLEAGEEVARFGGVRVVVFPPRGGGRR